MCGRFGLADPLQPQRAHGVFERMHADVMAESAPALLMPLIHTRKPRG